MPTASCVTERSPYIDINHSPCACVSPSPVPYSRQYSQSSSLLRRRRRRRWAAGMAASADEMVQWTNTEATEAKQCVTRCHRSSPLSSLSSLLWWWWSSSMTLQMHLIRSSCSSAVSLGYWDDPWIRHFVRKPARKPPLINRGARVPLRTVVPPPTTSTGYFVRFSAVQRAVMSFAERARAANQRWQIVSLGAGFDTLAWRLRVHAPGSKRLSANLTPRFVRAKGFATHAHYLRSTFPTCAPIKRR
jgi:hypothetical protein